MENIMDCIKFANENPVCYLATADGDQPRVRALLFWFADETGFYFQTGEIKEIPAQLRNNPRAEACFYHSGEGTGKMMRVCGKVEFIDSREWKEKALADRPFLKHLGMTADGPGLVIFRMAHGQAHFWTMENNLKPKEFIEF